MVRGKAIQRTRQNRQLHQCVCVSLNVAMAGRWGGDNNIDLGNNNKNRIMSLNKLCNNVIHV